jgi:hypothetical protein
MLNVWFLFVHVSSLFTARIQSLAAGCTAVISWLGAIRSYGRSGRSAASTEGRITIGCDNEAGVRLSDQDFLLKQSL